MNWKKSFIEIKDINNPLILFGVIIALTNYNGYLWGYLLAVVAVIVGVLGIGLKKKWIRILGGFLFALTGSYMVLSYSNFYYHHFGLVALFLIVLVAVLLIMEGIIVMVNAVTAKSVN